MSTLENQNKGPLTATYNYNCENVTVKIPIVLTLDKPINYTMIEALKNTNTTHPAKAILYVDYNYGDATFSSTTRLRVSHIDATITLVDSSQHDDCCKKQV